MSKGFGVRLAGAMFLIGPAAIHFAVAPEHLRSYPPYGVFFLALGGTQVALAVLILFRPSSRVLLGAAGLSLAVIALWLVSRTTGLPLAEVPWQPEAVGLPDVLATLMEWVAACLLLAADARLDSTKTFRLWGAAPGLTLAALLCLASTLAGMGAIGGGGH